MQSNLNYKYKNLILIITWINILSSLFQNKIFLEKAFDSSWGLKTDFGLAYLVHSLSMWLERRRLRFDNG